MVRFLFKSLQGRVQGVGFRFFCSDECRKMSFDRMGEKYV